MKRKGFTLIELVAVLVILAIITLIVTPLVLNIIKKSSVAADRRSVDVYGKSVELAIASYMMDTGHLPTNLDNLEVEYTGKEVVCNIKQQKENGGLYMSKCSVNGKEVKDSSSEDGYYHYGVRDLTNEEYIDMYGDALRLASVKYLEDNGSIVTDYKILNIDYKGKKVACDVTINYDGTIYLEKCTVAKTPVENKTYGKIVVPAVQELVSKSNSATTVNYEDGNKGEMYTFEHDATIQTEALTDYRYIGNEPNNYVTFNNETWRIIGVFTTENAEGNKDQRIKLISERRFYKEFDSGGKDWGDSTLKEYYNGDYYLSLDKDAKSMIDSIKYYLGGTDTGGNSALEFYNYERGNQVYGNLEDINWIGKIGVIYPSDYLYTYAKGVDDKCLSGSCYKQAGGTPANGWIFNIVTVTQWTMTPYWAGEFIIQNSGSLYNAYRTDKFGTRPVLYLKSSIKIKTGDGTQDHPYEFEI